MQDKPSVISLEKLDLDFCLGMTRSKRAQYTVSFGGKSTRIEENWVGKKHSSHANTPISFEPTQIHFQTVLFMPWQELGVGLGSQYSDACGFLSLQK